MSRVFDLKAGDCIRLWNQDCWRKIVKSELAPEEVGIARTIRLWFEDGESARYCSDGEVSGATAKKYYHDIAAYQKHPREGQIYKRPNGVILLITDTTPRKEEIVVRGQKEILEDMYNYITSTGYTSTIADNVLYGLELIAEYPTWQEAVNSKEFNNA